MEGNHLPPPSYESAIARDVWIIVAPYILPSSSRISDLCAACLVCRRWHEIFVPLLWGDPASHFEIDRDGDRDHGVFCDALSRFRRTLPIARFNIRKMTHTVRLPPARLEIYGGPKQTWLRDLLEYLPNLQALFVSGLSFLDHSSLMALRQVQYSAETASGGLRLLCADREPNTTSIGIVEALSHFRNLVYLDLSYTAPAKDLTVLSALSHLRYLQVLKLRGVGMRDQGAEVLTGSIGIRVRLLDLRDNVLTDTAVTTLIQGSFRPSEDAVDSWDRPGVIGLGPSSILGPESLRSFDLDGRITNQLRNSYTDQPVFEDLPHVGITHLFIAGNRLSAEGLASLLTSKKLHVLDAGSVDTVESGTEDSGVYGYGASLSGAERLIPILVTSASRSLTYLRISHSVVTKVAPILDDSRAIAHPAQRPAGRELGSETSDIVRSPSGPLSQYDLRDSKIQELLAKRPKNSKVFQPDTSQDGHLYLDASHLPHLKTLILTDLPSSVPASSHLITSLTRFITACADESLLATLQACSNYSLPPGRFRASAERQYARTLFALERIVLQITPVAPAKSEPTRKQSTAGTAWNTQHYHNPAFLKSSTGDEDGERLWAAAANDFSFFGEGGGEHEERVALAPEEEGYGTTQSTDNHRKQQQQPHPTEPKEQMVDLVSALAEFRRTKRTRYESLVLARRKESKFSSTTSGSDEELPISVEGHWEGEVKIVRNAVVPSQRK